MAIEVLCIVDGIRARECVGCKKDEFLRRKRQSAVRYFLESTSVPYRTW